MAMIETRIIGVCRVEVDYDADEGRVVNLLSGLVESVLTLVRNGETQVAFNHAERIPDAMKAAIKKMVETARA